MTRLTEQNRVFGIEVLQTHPRCVSLRCCLHQRSALHWRRWWNPILESRRMMLLSRSHAYSVLRPPVPSCEMSSPERSAASWLPTRGDRAPLLLGQNLGREEGRHERPRKYCATQRCHHRGNLTRSPVALRCSGSQNAQLRQVTPEFDREGVALGAGDVVAAAIATELAQRIDDRLLAVVPREIESHVAMPQRTAATARRWPDTPPCSRRNACRRMLQTWRSCSWVKPIAPESWWVSAKSCPAAFSA